MSEVFKKLNLKNETEILVINAPESFEPELASLPGVTVLRELSQAGEIQFALAFVTQQAEVDTLAREFAARFRGDALLWFAYPKGSSRRYKCEFNRNTGWMILGELGFEGVRQVAIDEDWSALRFRRVEYIKTMIRDETRAMSQGGRKRVTKNG